MAAATDTYEQLDSVRIGEDGVAEMDQHRRIIFVPRDEILSVELVFRSGAERPLVTAVLGVVLIGVAVLSVALLVLAITRGGLKVPMSLITGIALLLPAWWLLDLSFRKRWCLLVRGRKEMRKLVFQHVRDQYEIERFIASARNRFGYL
ncbi:MAG TPA: hypothetical protein VFN10_04585 [Thermoanaerobaculia bacterium]|nr:hypothetical protein [Thermoanaerobaculia bacterium]